ncbi:hypothetical protein D3C72_2414850 [compost metagenome]
MVLVVAMPLKMSVTSMTMSAKVARLVGVPANVPFEALNPTPAGSVPETCRHVATPRTLPAFSDRA